MVNIICIILLVVWTVCLVGMVYCTLKKLKRNGDVASYRVGLICRCCSDADLAERIVNKHTYEEMLQSSKPLEDKYWFTPDEIREINDNYISYLIRRRRTKRLKDSDF